MPHTFPFREHILEHRASPPGTAVAELAPICKELHSMSNYRVQNPATGEIVETFSEATDAEIESTVAAAHSTYLTWKDTDIQERAGIVRRAAEIFHERKDERAKAISVEMGNADEESADEVEFAADIIEYYGIHGPSLATDYQIPSTIPGTARIEALPLGALLGVMPWNFPYYQVARFA